MASLIKHNDVIYNLEAVVSIYFDSGRIVLQFGTNVRDLNSETASSLVFDKTSENFETVLRFIKDNGYVPTP